MAVALATVLEVPTPVSDPVFPRAKAPSAALYRFDLENPLLVLDSAAHAGTPRGVIIFRSSDIPVDEGGRALYLAPEFSALRLGGPKFDKVVRAGQVIGASRRLNNGLVVPLNDVMTVLGPELDLRCAINKDCTFEFSTPDGAGRRRLDTVETALRLANIVRERLRTGTWDLGDTRPAPPQIPLPNARASLGIHIGSPTFTTVTAAIKFLASLADPDSRQGVDGRDLFGETMSFAEIVDGARVGSPSRLVRFCVDVNRKIEAAVSRAHLPAKPDAGDPEKWYHQANIGIPSLGTVSIDGKGSNGSVRVRSWPEGIATFPTEASIDPWVVEYDGFTDISIEPTLERFTCGMVAQVQGSVSLPPLCEGNVLLLPWEAFQHPRRGVDVARLKTWTAEGNGIATVPAQVMFGANAQPVYLRYQVISMDGSTFSIHDNGIHITAVGRGRIEVHVTATPMDDSGPPVFCDHDARLAAIRVVDLSLKQLTKHLTREPVLSWLTP